jgi:mono/diheme cytochrome c family protein
MVNLPAMRIANYTILFCGCLSLCLAARPVLAQSNPPPLPPASIPAPRTFPIPLTAIAQPVVVPPNNPAVPGYPTLVFDAETKQYDPKPGEMIAPFTFRLTNVWTNEIRIDQVKASCGCTTAKLPATPWHIPPGGSGEVGAQINLAGKPPGLVTKTLTFFTSVGNRVVTLKANIPQAGTMLAGMSAVDRKAALALAAANPQAIFKADCAKCHVDKGVKSLGQDLYAADCGICHESSHRDSAVPDLHALKQPTDLEYWKTMISFGKPHTMMPGFAISQGGPLSDEQIKSLAAYLDRAISHHFSAAPMTNAAAAPRSLLGSGIYNLEPIQAQ